MDNRWGKGFGPEIPGSNSDLRQQLEECTAELRKKTNQVCVMASELAQVKQHEREQLATILHDNLQQLLVAAGIQIAVVNHTALPIKECKALSQADKIISQAIAVSRALTVDLSPPILHGARLSTALEWLARRMVELHRFTVELSIDPHAETQTKGLRILLFETVRELVFNSCKHSGCSRVRVQITRKQNAWVRVVVEDFGRGFDSAALSASMSSGERCGLFNIQQRLAHAGARMSVVSEPSVGTWIEILAPWIRVAPKTVVIANLM